TTLLFLRGPVIPGTSGLRAGAVIWQTVQGHCILALTLLLLLALYSVVRLRFVVLARHLEVAAAAGNNGGVDSGLATGGNGVRGQREMGADAEDPNNDAGGGVGDAAAAAVAVANAGNA
ncbi:unnamed protein product, partial [Ectocarpus sp. 8 AP-2014]